MRTDIDIARGATLRPIVDVAAELGLADSEVIPYGRYKAKVSLDAIAKRGEGKGKLVLVTGITPTPAGEGKSTVSTGLADALRLREQRVVLCLREPSLGPVFGMKGGATGGGYAQVVPMEEINLHFTGDFHAITSAHGLLAAMLDNHLYWGNELGIDTRRVTWPRTVDMNDRALRNIVLGLGGATGGVPREGGYVITAASEIMAIFGLAADHADLEERLGRIIVGYTRDFKPVRARELDAAGAMTVLLKDALAPNLVQTLGGTPAFVHAGPFGNIAHGCNSIIATRAGLALGDIVVTEAGFGSDLGMEKFFDIKCRTAGLDPAAAVVVATIRALKMHGGVPLAGLKDEDVEAVRRGVVNLEKHVENVRKFGVPPIVAINKFGTDTDAEIAAVVEACRAMDVPVAVADVHAYGGEGGLELADAVMGTVAGATARFKPLYDLELPLAEKIETVAREMYGAVGVDFTPTATRELGRLEENGLGNLPVCMAKTQYSFSDDPKRLGRPEGFRITVREATASAGAGFVVVKTGDIMTMPGLPRVPAAAGMRVEEDGTTVGLF
jgi:formate--tetrahydrofolate ligase